MLVFLKMESACEFSIQIFVSEKSTLNKLVYLVISKCKKHENIFKLCLLNFKKFSKSLLSFIIFYKILRQSITIISVYGKPWERVSPILVRLTSRSDSNFECLNISCKALIRAPMVFTTGLERTKENSTVFGRLI